MKLYRFFWILILALFLPFSLLSCSTDQQIKTTLKEKDIAPSGTVDESHPLLGKSVEEIKEIYGIDPLGVEAISNGLQWFFVDESGCPTIVDFGFRENIKCVATVTVFPVRTEAPSNEDFEKVGPNEATIYELVALFGIPEGVSSGSYGYVFYRSIEGDRYSFNLRIK